MEEYILANNIPARKLVNSTDAQTYNDYYLETYPGLNFATPAKGQDND